MNILRQQMESQLAGANYSECTIKSYVYAVQSLALHYGECPSQLSDEQVGAFLISLRERKLSWSTVNAYLSGIKWFYTQVLDRSWNHRLLPQQVIRYLGRYTHRVAISNDRILGVEGNNVRFRYKDYADHNRAKTMSLEVNEFIRRFLMHTCAELVEAFCLPDFTKSGIMAFSPPETEPPNWPKPENAWGSHPSKSPLHAAGRSYCLTSPVPIPVAAPTASLGTCAPFKL